MVRHAALTWMRALLPLVMLRLLLPTGLMLAPGEHGVALILCSMELPRAADMSGMDMSAPMDMGHSTPDHGNANKDTVCPFAAAAAPAPVSTQLSATLPPASAATLNTLRLEAQRTAVSGPLRSQISRGPPALS